MEIIVKPPLLHLLLLLLISTTLATSTTTTATASTTPPPPPDINETTFTPEAIDVANTSQFDAGDDVVTVSDSPPTTTATTTTTTTTTDDDDDDDGVAGAGGDDGGDGFLYGDFCLCDLKVGGCDVNCCCDSDCSAFDRLAFSHCIPRPPPTPPDSRYCFHTATVASTSTPWGEVRVEGRQGGLTCIVVDNLPHRTHHTPAKVARSVEEFESLMRGQVTFPWPHTQPDEGKVTPPGTYTYGDPLWAYDDDGDGGDGVLVKMGLPIAILGSECQAYQPILYLKDSHTSCSRHILHPPTTTGGEEGECQGDSAGLSAAPYLSFTLPAPTPGTLMEDNITATEEEDEKNTTTPQTPPQDATNTTTNATTTTTTTRITPYLCQTDTNGDETCHETNVEDIPKPAYLNGVCVNVVRRIDYEFHHNGTNGVLKALGFVRLGSVAFGSVYHKQTFAARFVWAGKTNGEVFVRSGRPGYVLGKPVLMGRLVHNVTEEGEVRSAISLDPDPSHWLTLLSPGPTRGQCQTRSQVAFGIDVRSGCTLDLSPGDLEDCEGVKGRIMTLLLGPQLGDLSDLRIGSFGDSSVVNVADWLPVLVPAVVKSPAEPDVTSPFCRDVILSLHLDIAYSLQGQRHNPQAKIVGVVLRKGTPQPLPLPDYATRNRKNGKNVVVELVTSVAFVEVTQTPLSVYAKPPALDVMLPYDFFYPFLPGGGGGGVCVRGGCWGVWVLCVFLWVCV